MGVCGPRVFLGRKDMILRLLDDLTTNLHVYQAKQQARIDYLRLWSSKEAFLDQNRLCRERVLRVVKSSM